MRTRRMFGPGILAIWALALTGLLSAASVNAQAVSSLPIGIYEGTCASDTLQFVVDLEPIVPAASISGAAFTGSEDTIDVASSTTNLNNTIDDLMQNGPLSIVVSSGTGADATVLSCGVIGGYVHDNQVSFGIDDVNGSGISGIATVAGIGSNLSITVILGEFPMESASTAAGAVSTSTTCEDITPVTSPHGPPVAGDADGDNISDTDEATLGTDPNNPDTDADGIMDGLETGFSGTDPLDADSFPIDTDLDGLPDDFENSVGTDPSNADSDNDGITDGWEFFLGNDPLDAEVPADSGTDTSVDPDQDGLSTRTEIELGTDPANPDTDGDGVTDGDEVAAKTNPLAPGC